MAVCAATKLLKEAKSQRVQKTEIGGVRLPSKQVIFQNAYMDTIGQREVYLFALWKVKQMEKGNDDVDWQSFVRDFHTPDRDYNTRLHQFAQDNQTLCLLACLHNDKSELYMGSAVNHLNKSMETPLMVAIRKRHYEVAVLLLTHGANPSYRWEEDYPSPLHYAAIYANKDFAQLLVRYGASPSVTYYDEENVTPMQCVAKRIQAVITNVVDDCSYQELEEAEVLYEYFLRLNGTK